MKKKYINHEITKFGVTEKVYLEVTYNCSDTDGGKYSGSMYLKNPLALYSYKQDFCPQDIARIMDEFDRFNPPNYHVEKVQFKDENARDMFVQSLEEQKNPYAIYIENFGQMESAEKENKIIDSKLEAIKKYGYLPEMLTSDSIYIHEREAVSILRGLENGKDKHAFALAIRWLKRFGYNEVVDRDNNIAYYELQKPMLGTDMVANFVYIMKKDKSGNYHMEFRYSYVNNSDMERGYGHIWSTEENLSNSTLLKYNDRDSIAKPQGIL